MGMLLAVKGLFGSNVVVAVVSEGICRYGWLRFQVLLNVLYDLHNI